jgi:hypothetical protein
VGGCYGSNWGGEGGEKLKTNQDLYHVGNPNSNKGLGDVLIE